LPHDEERLYGEEEKAADDRQAFERDRGRIIHSAAFRRLQGKTQVFGVRYGDFFRTRLTHSLEVAQIGKALALKLGADPTLVEAICLAHDIGHPPFGHHGEEVLRARMAAHGKFEANAQNLRVLTQLEVKSVRYAGLNLTRSVLDGLLKHKAMHRSMPGLNQACYADDADLLNWICAGGSVEERSFECQLMDWADDVAYSAHDLEDGIFVGMINMQHLQRPSNRDAVIGRVRESAEGRGRSWSDTDVLRELDWLEGRLLELEQLPTPRHVRAALKDLTSRLINEFVRCVQAAPRLGWTEELSERYRFGLMIPEAQERRCEVLKQVAFVLVFVEPRVTTLAHRAHYMVDRLFEVFQVEENATMYPLEFQDRFAAAQDDTARRRVACDYIATMTDFQAERTYQRLFVPGYESILDPLV
jgi:dGTPase